MATTQRKLYEILLPRVFAVVSALLFIAFAILATVGVALSIHKVVKKSTSYYILTGASGMSVLCAILMTFSTALKVNSAKKVKKEKWLAEAEQRRQSSLDLKEIEGAAPAEERDDEEVEGEGGEGDEEKGHTTPTEDMIAGPRVVERQTSTIRNFTPLAIFTLYLCYQFIFLGILSVLWTITIINNSTGIQTSPWPYLVSEFLIGILATTFLLLAAIFGGVVLKFITRGALDASHLLPTLLAPVSLKESKNESFWVIAEICYCKIDKPKFQPSSKKYKFVHAWDFSLSTWCLTAVLASALIIAVSFFANGVIAEMRMVDSCVLLGPEVEIYSCFTQLRLDFVNCSDPENDEEDIRCFKFLDFLNEADPIASVLEAVVLYLLTVEIFDIIFKCVRILLRIKLSNIWGIITVVLGLIILVVALLLIVFSYGFGFDLALSRQLQLVVIGVAVTGTGILLVRGKWQEKVPEAVESVELVSVEEMQFAQLIPSVSSNGATDERNSPAAEEVEVEKDIKKSDMVVEIQPEGDDTNISSAL